MAKRVTTEEFISRSRAVHGDKYDYSKTVYVRSSDKLTVTCPEHGDFEQLPAHHFNGVGCAKCAGVAPSTLNSFIEKSKETHGERYDYSKSAYLGAHRKILIGCPEHGPFRQTPSNHMNGHGCPMCAGKHRPSTDEFILRAKQAHGEKYLYPDAQYANIYSRVRIVCGLHGEFTQRAQDHAAGHGCPKCVGAQSRPEDEIIGLVRSLGLATVHGDRTLIAPKEIDILVPEVKLAIEFNGNYWHSDQQKPKNYHFEKSRQARDKGYRVIHILEADWAARKTQIENIIRSACGKAHGERLNARDCEVRDVGMAEANAFFDTNHIQGAVHTAKVRLGLFHGSAGLVAVMTLSQGANLRGEARLSAQSRGASVPWSLTRFATSANVRGAAGKLFKAAVRVTGATEVVSYSMNDYFTGGMYERLGFKAEDYGTPDYRVFHPRVGVKFKHYWQRRNIPSALRAVGREDVDFNPDKSADPRTEFQIEDMVGALRIWDSGKTRWRWTDPADQR